MKKNTLQSLVIILLSASLNLSSQSSLLVTNITSSTTINNNAVITKNISANNSDLISLNIKNNSVNTLTNSSMFPNPSNLTTSLHFDSKVNDENAKLTILNAVGEMIMSQKADIILGENRINIQTSSFASGTYYAYIVSGSNIIERKFMVSK